MHAYPSVRKADELALPRAARLPAHDETWTTCRAGRIRQRRQLSGRRV